MNLLCGVTSYVETTAVGYTLVEPPFMFCQVLHVDSA